MRCFVLLPSRPSNIWDDLYSLMEDVCSGLKGQLQITEFDVTRAMDIVSPGVIHYEIWDGIKKADIVIADVTGHNPNVMFELGVTASVKSKQRVILLRERTEEPDAFPFDMMPARHITYQRTRAGFQKLANDLGEAILQALVGAPFDDIPSHLEDLTLPFEASLDDGHDNPAIWTSDLSHRRILPDCLEFGSLYWFKHSWASIGNLKLESLHVKAEMRLTLLAEREVEDQWIGISVRNQGFYANYGWLVHVRPSGEVALAIPKNDKFEMDVSPIAHTRPLRERGGKDFVELDIVVTDKVFKVKVDGSSHELLLADMGYVPPRGRILFQTAFARAGLRRVRVEAPSAE